MASSILLELDGLRFIYDFGRGTTHRLAQLGLRQNDLSYIILSHFHPDHLSDLIPYLQAACWSRTDLRTTSLTIYGPIGLQKQMDRILNLFERNVLSSNRFRLKIVELPAGLFTINNRSFTFVPLHHHNNHGLSFICNQKKYAFTGDCEFHDDEIVFLKNADLAIIDAGHISDDEIVELAVKTAAKKIVCSHLYREIDRQHISKAARAEGYTGELIMGEDLMTFTV
jgi:ribonuclease BN (tRNA processing enzyme)